MCRYLSAFATAIETKPSCCAKLRHWETVEPKPKRNGGAYSLHHVHITLFHHGFYRSIFYSRGLKKGKNIEDSKHDLSKTWWVWLVPIQSIFEEKQKNCRKGPRGLLSSRFVQRGIRLEKIEICWRQKKVRVRGLGDKGFLNFCPENPAVAVWRKKYTPKQVPICRKASSQDM